MGEDQSREEKEVTHCTTTITSLDGAPIPHEFLPRTRT
jgi:hypothetical protein